MDRKSLQHLSDAEEFRHRDAAKETVAKADELTLEDLSVDESDLEGYYVDGRLVTSLDSPDDHE